LLAYLLTYLRIYLPAYVLTQLRSHSLLTSELLACYLLTQAFTCSL